MTRAQLNLLNDIPEHEDVALVNPLQITTESFHGDITNTLPIMRRLLSKGYKIDSPKFTDRIGLSWYVLDAIVSNKEAGRDLIITNQSLMEGADIAYATVNAVLDLIVESGYLIKLVRGTRYTKFVYVTPINISECPKSMSVTNMKTGIPFNIDDVQFSRLVPVAPPSAPVVMVCSASDTSTFMDKVNALNAASEPVVSSVVTTALDVISEQVVTYVDNNEVYLAIEKARNISNIILCNESEGVHPLQRKWTLERAIPELNKAIAELSGLRIKEEI